MVRSHLLSAPQQHAGTITGVGRGLRSRSLRGRDFWRRLHRDESGAVSLETILIIGAIALPILVFVLKFGWPRIREFFSSGLDELEIESDRTRHGG